MDNNTSQEPTRKAPPPSNYQYNIHSMQALATSLNSSSNSNNTNDSSSVYKPGGFLFGAFDINNSMNFFQQQTAGSSRASDTDIGAMDDVQFSASLDALLNGDQSMAGLSAPPPLNNNQSSGSSVSGLTGGLPSLPGNNNNAGNTQQQQQQQPPMGNMQQYYVSAPAAGGVPHHQQQQQPPQQQHYTISNAAASQLAGLPLASANQAGLQLVPAGPHSAAQMSLSAGHAAATGAFHPGNASANGQMVAAAPFPWTMTNNNITTNNNSNVASAPLSINGSTGGGMSVIAAAPVSSAASATMNNNNNTNCNSTGSVVSRGSKRQLSSRDVCPVSEDEGDREKRKRERNLREQQRSHKITEQIAELKEVLSAANQQFKPDKYSTLTKVAEYIKELQDRSKFLDGEHKKLLETITETNEIVNSQYVPAYASGSDTMSNDLLANDGTSSSLDDESAVYVRGIDYKIAFKGCGIPLALASIDGRFLDCNDTFLELTGYSREELLPLEKPGRQNTVRFSPDQDDSHKKNLSLFNLLSRDGMEQVFMAMSEMLKQPGSIGTTAAAMPTEASRIADFWSGPVKLGRQDDLPVKLNVTLVRTSRRRPKFFNCALTALDGDDEFRFDDQTTITTPSQDPSDGTKESNSTSNDQQQTTSVAPVSVGSAQQVASSVENPGGQSGT